MQECVVESESKMDGSGCGCGETPEGRNKARGRTQPSIPAPIAQFYVLNVLLINQS